MMWPPKGGSLLNHLMDCQSDRGVVRADHRSGADTDDRVDWYLVSEDPTEHSEMRGTS